jgi:hypothetical protein
MVPIDCTSAGVINFSRSMKWPLHNVNRPDDRSDKSGPMLFPGYGPRILSVSALSLSPVAVPLASGRGQEAATSLSGPSLSPTAAAQPLPDGTPWILPRGGRTRVKSLAKEQAVPAGWCSSLVSVHRPLRVLSVHWYLRYRRFTAAAANAGGHARAALVPHLIHNRSGAGSDVLGVDLDGDGRMDIITSTRSGTHIFWGKPAD